MTWNIAPSRVASANYAWTGGRMSVLAGTQTVFQGSGAISQRLVGMNEDGGAARNRAFDQPVDRFDPGGAQARAEQRVAAGGVKHPLLEVARSTYGNSVRQVYNPRDSSLASKLERLLREGFTEFSDRGSAGFVAKKPGDAPWSYFPK